MDKLDIDYKKLEVVKVEGGNIVKLIASNSTCFQGFGEAYISNINFGFIKAWKRHKRMHLFLSVPRGEVKFVFLRNSNNVFEEFLVSEKNHKAIVVAPGIWFGFQGINMSNCILNIADIHHDEKEVERRPITSFNYNW